MSTQETIRQCRVSPHRDYRARRTCRSRGGSDPPQLRRRGLRTWVGGGAPRRRVFPFIRRSRLTSGELSHASTGNSPMAGTSEAGDTGEEI